MLPVNSHGQTRARRPSRRPLTVDVAGRFLIETLRGVRREAGDVSAASLERSVDRGTLTVRPPSVERRRYLALCERAWLHWTRDALDRVSQLSLNQTTVGAFTPTEITRPSHASEAAVRCRLHDRLLQAIVEPHQRPSWTWQLEAARHVHASTEKALRAGAAVETWTPEDVQTLCGGVDAAEDALVAAMLAGFVNDSPREFVATIAAITCADLRP